MTTETTSTVHLADLAREALAVEEQERADQTERGRQQDVERLRPELSRFDIEPCGDPFHNHTTGNMAFPIIQGGWDEENERYVHSVAVEWDGDGYEARLVAEINYEHDEHSWRKSGFYPVGRLRGLADIARAMENGGRVAPSSHDGVAGRIDFILSRACVATDDAGTLLTGFEAVCTALLDVAAAIRETAGA